jgi:hypothetical protein
VELSISERNESSTSAQKTGIFSATRQRDSYLFQAVPGQTLNIVVNATGPSPMVNPLVELYNPEDLLIAASDDFINRGRNAALTVTLPPLPSGPGTYRIVASAVDEPGSPSAFSGGTAYPRKAATGSYELKVFTGPMTPPLQDWRALHFAAGILADAGKEATVWGNLANPDGDLLPNLLEYFTGSNPLVSDTDPIRPGLTASGVPSLVYQQARHSPGVEGFPEWTHTLGSWRRDQVVTEVISENASTRIVRASFPGLGGGGSGFVRLAAEVR